MADDVDLAALRRAVNLAYRRLDERYHCIEGNEWGVWCNFCKELAPPGEVLRHTADCPVGVLAPMGEDRI